MSSQKDFLFNHHKVAGIYPVADFINVTGTTDIINMRDYRRATFCIDTGVSTGGTSNAIITILVNTTNTTVGAVAIPFRYKVCASSTTVDAWGASANATTAGFSMTAGSNYKYICEVNAEEVLAALPGATWIYLLLTEVTNDPIVGGVDIILSEPRFPQPVPLTVIA